MGIAELIVMAMEKEETPRDDAIKKIWMVDSKGLIVKVRFFNQLLNNMTMSSKLVLLQQNAEFIVYREENY